MIAKLWRARRRRDLPLLLQAYLTLLLVDLGVRGAGLMPVWRLIRRSFRRPTANGGPDGAELARLERVVACAARNHLYPMRCLPRSLALAWLLARRGVGAEFRLGARRRGGRLEAHAWLERSGKPLFPATEPESPFRPLETTTGAMRTGEVRGGATVTAPSAEVSPGRYAAMIYGLSVRSDLPLPGTWAGGQDPDVDLVRAPLDASRPFEPGPDSCVYRNAGGLADGKGVIEVYRRGAWYCLRCTGFVDFYFSDGRRVAYVGEPGVSPRVIVSLFLGPVCAVLLELRGRPCLHASAVRFGRAAVAFAGHSGTGKSSLAARLVDRGYPLLSDDILPLTIRGADCLGAAGYPQMKLDPVQARRLSGLTGPWAPVVPGSDKCAVPVGRDWGEFAREPCPLAAVYVLERDPATDGIVRIDHLTPGEGLLELLRFSFCARLVEQLGMQERRLPLLAEVLSRVRVRRLRFPSGLAHVGRVQSAILDDLIGTPGDPPPRFAP